MKRYKSKLSDETVRAMRIDLMTKYMADTEVLLTEYGDKLSIDVHVYLNNGWLGLQRPLPERGGYYVCREDSTALGIYVPEASFMALFEPTDEHGNGNKVPAEASARQEAFVAPSLQELASVLDKLRGELNKETRERNRCIRCDGEFIRGCYQHTETCSFFAVYDLLLRAIQCTSSMIEASEEARRRVMDAAEPLNGFPDYNNPPLMDRGEEAYEALHVIANALGGKTKQGAAVNSMKYWILGRVKSLSGLPGNVSEILEDAKTRDEDLSDWESWSEGLLEKVRVFVDDDDIAAGAMAAISSYVNGCFQFLADMSMAVGFEAEHFGSVAQTGARVLKEVEVLKDCYWRLRAIDRLRQQ